jgi:hypothetical protein
MRPVYDSAKAIEIARLDDCKFDLTLDADDLTTGTSGPLTTGTVSAHLSLWPPSLTPLPGAAAPLSHLTAGRWLGSLDTTVVSAALAPLRDNTRLAVVYVVEGAMARYREAVVVTMRRSDAA